MNKTTYEKMVALERIMSRTRHDLSNILNGITGFAELISLKSENSDGIRENCQRIVTSCNDISEIISNNMRFASDNSEDPEEIFIQEAIKKASDMLSFIPGDAINISLELNASENLIKANRTKFNETILNLGKNAIEAMPDGGEIKISTSYIVLDDSYCEKSHFPLVSGRYLEIRVKDTGVGADHEDAELFFEPFYSSHGDGGRGFGLTIAFFNVLAMKGEIDLQTEPGQGTEVIIRLPVYKQISS